MIFNGIDYISLLLPTGVTDGSTGTNGNWSTEQASSFSIVPSSPGSEMRIRALQVSVSEVPLPAGIYLFLSGLVGLGLMRGRNG